MLIFIENEAIFMRAVIALTATVLLATPAAALTPQEKAYLGAITLGLIDRANIECQHTGNKINEAKRWELVAKIRESGGDSEAAYLGAEVMMWALRKGDICELATHVGGPNGKFAPGTWVPR